MQRNSKPGDNLIACNEHIDVNYDMLCDVCGNELSFLDYIERKSVEAVADDSSVVKVTGNMPEDTLLESVAISKDEATSMAQNYLPDITSGDVLAAYDISMVSNTIEYQPGDYNQVVKVNISNLDLEINDTVALLHIIDDNNYEILPLSSVNGNEIEFKATRFSPYILIYVDTYTITFSGDKNFKLLTTEGTTIISGDIFDEESIVDGVTIPAGTNFNFVITPNEGYGITDVSLVDATDDASGDNYLVVSGGVLGRTGKINKVSQDLVIDVTTVLAPIVTSNPEATKAIVGTQAKFYVSAENATTFTWQYRENENDYWKDITAIIGTSEISGDTSTLTTVPVTYSMTGYEYRCLIGDDNFTIDERVKSDIAVLIVTQDPAMAGETPIVLVQPQSQKVIGGEKATFEVTAMGTNLTFTWQYRENEDDYWKAATSFGSSKVEDVGTDGITKKSTFITNVTTYEMTGYDIRCVVGNNFYNGDLGVKSNIVNLIVTNNGDAKDVQYLDLQFLSDIESQKVKLGDVATFTAETKSADTFRWQYRNSKESDFWLDVDSTIGTGYNTATLELDTSKMTFSGDTLELTNNISGYEFRCVISNSAIPTYEKTSNVAFLVVAQDTLTLDVIYDEPKIDLTALSGDSTSEITLVWTMQDGLRYELYYYDNSGELALLDDNAITPYTHKELEHNTTYEYVIYGYKDGDASYRAVGTTIASTAYDDIYDIINKDTIKPVLDNFNITPDSGKVSPTSEVVLTFNATDENYDALNGSLLYPDEIEVLIDGIEATTAEKELTKASIPSGERFTLSIKNIWGNGNLSIKIPSGAIFDLAKNGNDEYLVTTDITVVRSLVSPVTNFSATSGASDNSITVTWVDNENTEDVSYVLEVSAGDNNWIVLNANASSPYPHNGLSKNMSFEYRIKVVATTGDESPYVYTLGRTEYDPNYGDVMIDTINPVINLIEINPDVDYVGATQELVLTFESTDENYFKDMTTLTADKFIIKTAGEVLADVTRSLTVEDTPSGERFILTLSNITGTGSLVVGVPEKVIYDAALNPNEAIEFNTGIYAINGSPITDNAPTLGYVENDVHSITVSNNQISTVPIASIVYEYRLSGDGEFIKAFETISGDIIISGLSSDTDYEVRTTVTDVANNSATSQSAFIRTKKIDASAITIDHETKEWTNLVAPNPSVTATITWNDTKNYTHQYSTNGVDWITVTGDTTELPINDNVTIYARYSDSVGHSDPVEYEIKNIDKIKPVIGKVEIPEGKANTKTIKVSEITDEGGSGLKGYYVNTEADLTNVTWTDLTTDNFEFVATENDVYYIWVIDNAGNISTATSANVTDIVNRVDNVEFPTEFEVDVFETKTPTLTYSGEAKEIVYTIEDNTKADIDPSTGAVTGKASGDTTITVTITNFDGTEEKYTCKLKVNAIEPTIVLDKNTLDFIYGESAKTINITECITSGDLSVTSNNQDVATATLNGNVITVTPIGYGTTTITLKAEETPQYLAKEIDITVTVGKRVIVVTWSGDTFTYDKTEKEVTAIITNLVDGDTVGITYTGNKETNAGDYTAEVIGVDNPNYTIEGASNLTHNWKINKADRTIEMITELLVTYGIPENITFTYTGEDVTAVVDSGDGSVITAVLTDDQNGGTITVNAVTAGTERITVTIPESTNYNSIEASVNVTTSLAEGEIVVSSSDVTLTYGDDPKEIKYNYSGDGEITVSSSNENVAKVDIDEDRNVLIITPVNASATAVTITINATQTAHYEAAETTIKVTVNPRPVVLTWSGDTFTYDGTEKEVTATVYNKVGDDVIDVTAYTDNKKTNANTYMAIATALNNSNYTLSSGENTTHNWVIERADINPTLTMEDYVYGGTKTSPKVSGNSGDANVTYYYYASGDDASNAKDWATVTDSLSLDPGEYVMYAVIDESENYNSATTDEVVFYVIVGNMDIVFTENGEVYDHDWTNNDVVATITVPEEVTNLTAIRYRFDGDDTIYEEPTTSNTISITFNENVNSKVYFVGVNVQGRDVTAESTGYVLMIDKTKPVIGSVTAPADKANTKDITVSNITDAGGSGIAGYYVSTDANTNGVTWTPFSGDSFTYKVSENDTYYVFVIDTAGNISDVKEIEVSNIVDEVTNASIADPIEIDVFDTINSPLTYSGEAKEIIYEFADSTKATADSINGTITGDNAGTTDVTITIKNYDENIPDIVLTTTLIVKPRVVTLTWSGDKFIYDGTPKKVEATVTNARVGDTVTVTIYTDNEKTVVGTYTAIAEELNDPNYTLEGTINRSHEWEILPESIEPTLVMNDYVYGGEKATPSIIGNVDGGKETFYVYSGDDESKAINWDLVDSSIYLAPGEYKMYATVDATANYSGAKTNTVEFEVKILDITVELTENGNPYDSEWTNNDVVATITVPPEVKSLGSVYYRINGQTALVEYDPTTLNGNVVTITFNKNFNNEISFVAVNAASRPITNESATYIIKVDKTKPVVGYIEVIPANNQKANTKLISVSNITDVGGSGIAGYYVGTDTNTDGVAWVPFSGDNFKYEVSENDTYYVFVKDTAGNISDVTANSTITVENIVDKVTGATFEGELIVEVDSTISAVPALKYEGEPEKIVYSIEDETLATIEPSTGTITGVASGDTKVIITITDYDGTVTVVSGDLTVIAREPNLTINEPTEFTFVYGDPSGETTFSYDGDGEITVTSDKGDVASVERVGNRIIVTPGNAGDAVITISATETPHVKAVEKTINVKVNPRPVILTWSGDVFTYDKTPKTVTATINNLVSGDVVNIIYTDNEKTNAGSYTAIASDVDNPNYTVVGGTNTSHNWKINKAPRIIDMIDEITVEYGTNGEITFTYDGEDTNTVVVESSSIDVANVQYVDGNNGGTITVIPAGAGTCDVTVNVSATDNFEAAKDTCKVTVEAADPELTVDDDDITLVYGDAPVSVQYNYTGNAETNNIVATSSDPYIATPTITGNQIIITPTGAGTATITVTAPATAQYNAVSTTFNVTVNPRPINIIWGQDEFTYDGTEKTITIDKIDNIVGADVINLTYSGNKETNAGEYVVEVIALDNKDYTLVSGENITHDWKINKAERVITVQDEIVLDYGVSGEVTFTYQGEDVTAEVTNANDNVATITYEDGLRSGIVTVKGEAQGESVVTIYVPESANYKEATDTFLIKIELATPELTVPEPNLTFTYGDADKEIKFNYTGNGNVDVTTSNANVADATVVGDKVIINPGVVGTATLTLISTKTNQFDSVSTTINVTVNPRPVELDWGNTILAYTGTLRSVTATVKNIVAGDTVEVTGYEGNTATEIGTYTARATAISNDNYTLTNGINVVVDWRIREVLPPDIIVKQGDTTIKTGEWASGDVTITIESVDITGVDVGYEYSFNERDWLEYTGTTLYTEETEGRIIYARALNKQNGALLSLVGEHELKIDKSDPAIKITSVSTSESVNGVINKDSEVTIEITIEDFISGIENDEFTAEDIKILAAYKGETKELTGIQKVIVADAANDGKENGTYKFVVTLSGIEENGRLSLRINEKSVYDRAGRFNQMTTLNLGLTADNEGPDIGPIKTSADSYGRVFGEDVELEVTAKDDSGISGYEWQVSKDGKTWETFSEDETPAEISEAIYKGLEDGVHHFRVVVTDIVGNQSISQISTVNINITMNRKPTIRFESKQVSAIEVEIIAIVKSTKNIESITVNTATQIGKDKWNIEKTNNEITITVSYTARANGTYVWTVVDEIGNVTTEEFNVTTIDNTLPDITHKVYDATEYSPARIEFESEDQDVRISKVIRPNGQTTNIITKTSFAGMTFGTVDFTRKVTVQLNSTIDFEPGTIFVFENKSFQPVEEQVNEDVETKVMYVRTVSTGLKLFTELFGTTFNGATAETLVNQMEYKTREIHGTVNPYYGISANSVELKVSEQAELTAIGYLAEATSTPGKALKLNQYGDAENLKATVTQNTNGSDTTYRNGNVTGSKNFGKVLNWGDTDDNTFRITIHAK